METVMKILHIAAALAVTFAGSLGASAAQAQAPAAAEGMAVAYADLDLSTRSGVATLNRRILTAVETACGPQSDADLHGKNAIAACRHRTFEQAVSQAHRAIALARGEAPTVLAGR
jgi:UrcA family protein